MNDIITKYRPKLFKDVVGQKDVCASLKRVLEKGSARSFIFTGPSGTGKTTLARIIALKMGCDPKDMIEVDAASNSGIDAMKEVASRMQYQGFHGARKRAAIIDEAHALSKPAWQALLKVIEEPPAHAAWILCTTESGKIPDTIATRCVQYELKPVKKDDLFFFLKKIVKAEGMTTGEKVLSAIASKAEGSPRRALSYLAACEGCKTSDEALDLLRQVADGDDLTISLARAITKGESWSTIVPILKRMKEASTNPESVRIVLSNWFTGVLLNARSSDAAMEAAGILSYFDKPYPQQSGFPALVMSISRVVLNEE